MPIGALAADKSSRIAEYKKRKQRFELKRVPTAELEPYQAQGWELSSTLLRGVRVKKQKPEDEQLENDFWSVLYLFGYKQLNIGRKFQIEITENQGRKVSKQVDVFALDGETVVVAECKSNIARRSRSMQKDLGEFEANKGPIARALRTHFGEPFNRKIIWAFVTRNVDWSKNDIARAFKFQIRVITEKEMRYFSEIAVRLGPSGRFQFHAEFLAKSAAISRITVPAIRTKLGGARCYFFIAPPRKLLPISFVNHRDLRDPEAAPSYQRLITRARLRDVAAYIGGGGYFANAILVNFKDEVRFDRAAPETEDGVTIGTLTLPDTYKSVWIIDGQHRLYGFAELNEDDTRHRVPVIAFEKLPQEEEGRLFKTINSEQRKVSKNLIDELRGEQDLHSTDRQKQIRAVAARVVDQLRNEVGGPFEDRIKSVDLPASPDRALTLTSICNAVVGSGLIGRVRPGADARFVQGPLSRDDAKGTIEALAEALSSYFSLVRGAHEVRWAAGKRSHLCTNTGVEAYIRLFGELCRFLHHETRMDPRELQAGELVEQIRPYLEPALGFVGASSEEDFGLNFKVAFGSGGPASYFYRLCTYIRVEFPSFSPDGLEDYLRETADERRLQADEQVRQIQTRVPQYVVKVLRSVYPGDNFLERAVKNRQILVDAFEKRTDAPVEERESLETYLDFLDFRKIVEAKENWPHFVETLSLPMPDEKKGQTKYLRWFDDVNRLRRIPAHPFGKRYKDEDIVALDYIFQQLVSRGVMSADV